MTLRDNTRILAAAQAKGLSVSTNAQGDMVVAKGNERVLIQPSQDGPGAPITYDYLRVSDGEAWRFSAQDAVALVESGMTATHLGKSVAGLSPAELQQRIGGDRGSTRANRAAAYRQQGYAAKTARAAAGADERGAAAAAREPAWMKELSPEEEAAKARMDMAIRAARAERESGIDGYFGPVIGKMSPEEILRELGRDSGSDRLDRYEAYRRSGDPAGRAMAEVRRQEQANWRSAATAGRTYPAPKVSEVAAVRMRQQAKSSWEQRLEAAAARAARTLRQERARGSGRDR